MESRSWLIIAILICSVTLSSCRELKVTVKHKHNHKQHEPAKYNHTLATILVQYASAVYMSDLTELFTWTCSRCNGLTEGFEILELIVDVKWCLQGFVGFATNLNAVVIAFRGTQETSIQNWVEDLFWKQLDINYPGVDGAMVHHGFYNAYNDSSLRPGVLSAVQLAKKLYGDTDIMVTGHSMGGAMAALCGLDLRLTLGKQQKVQVMTFGQPRIGNAVFASYYSQVVPDTFRVTHGNDMVPHLPPYYSYFPQKTYHHFPREVWIRDLAFGSFVYTVEKVCDGSGEDPTCSRSVRGNSIADHLIYYGVEMGCNESTSTCRIVMDQGLAAYGSTDVDGNFVVLRDPPKSVLKLNADGGNRHTLV
ncbi:lipase-like [Salvia splendens]|uniref:lipase-like n=1 Tax=Salvia splendens TaxID=180675 RepID=UPI001C274D33|nr:lipase-like [Salvia splendens]